jgi:hypothetical protein
MVSRRTGLLLNNGVRLGSSSPYPDHINCALTSDFTAAAGGMQAIVVDQRTGTMMAGADPRRTGYAVG